MIAQVKISFTEPPLVPTLFQAGVVSTGIPERDFALSPDETELFYTIQSPLGYFQTIVYMRKDLKGIWSNPQIAPFAGNYSDLEPTFSPDGKRLLFHLTDHLRVIKLRILISGMLKNREIAGQLYHKILVRQLTQRQMSFIRLLQNLEISILPLPIRMALVEKIYM